MKEFRLSLEERETVLRTNDLPGEGWDVWTFSKRWAARLRRAGYEVKKDHQGGWSCRVPADRIKITRPEKRKTGFAMARLTSQKPTVVSFQTDEIHRQG